MTSFNKILDQAKEIEAKIKEGQEKIKKIKAEGVSGSNSVKLTLNGEGEMTEIYLSDELLKEEKAIIEEAILDAMKSAHEISTSTMKERMEDLTGGFKLNLPGMGEEN